MVFNTIKNNLVRNRLALFVLLAFLVSCQKDASVPNDPNGNGGSTSGSFSWISAGTTVHASEFYYISAFNNIVAIKVGYGTSVDIVLDNLDQGVHNIDPSQGITFEYLVGGKTYQATSGSLTISQKSSNKMSGSFSVEFAGSSIGGLDGLFSNISEK